MIYITVAQDGMVAGLSNQPTTMDGYTSVAHDTPLDPNKNWRYQNGEFVEVQPSLQSAKDAKWGVIKAARDAAQYAGFMWDGSRFDSDAASQQKIIGACQWASLNSALQIDWTLADNTVRTLSAQEMQQVAQALGVYVDGVYDKGRTLRQQIESATTISDLDAIKW